MKLVIIIPAYNEEKTISSVIKSIPQDIPGILEKEIIVIDDGSIDSTAEASKKTGAKVISHLQNKGLGVAFSTGVKEALLRKTDLMVSIDADGQFDPRDILQLIQPVKNDKADFVSGSRFMNKSPIVGIPKIKLFGNKLLAKFISLVCGQKFTDVSCGFRAYSKEALLNLNLFGTFTYTQEAILNLSFKGLRMKEIPISVKYFPQRTSRMTKDLGEYVFKAAKIIFRTILDYKPLKFLGWIGAVVFLAGLILDVAMIYIFFQTNQFTPYKYIGILGLILNIFGLFLFVIGLIADILNRIRRIQEGIFYYQKRKFYYGE